jgi:hypothetical protein
MTRTGKGILLIFIISSMILLGCGGGKMADKESAAAAIKGVPEASWKSLAGKKIYFGHMSVGNDMIEGIHDIAKEIPQIRLNIVETNNPSNFDRPLFAHSSIGKNEDPGAKIDSFVQYMDNGLGSKADIAFFKFCYIDILSATDADEVFNRYKNAMEMLKKKYPKVTFVHVTAPLRLVQTGVLVPIKKIIGRPVGGYADNIKRSRFNELLRQEYKGKEPVFDLARIESTYPDGRRFEFDSGGKSYESLVADYTSDGGHLNEYGRKIVAAQLLAFLANLSN